MLRIILVRPGSTDFDEQGRIKGSLSIPLNKTGRGQVDRVVDELSHETVDAVYCSPCESALETAEQIAQDHSVKRKKVQRLENLDHGLWHGKLIDEVRRQQPRIYKSCQQHPEDVCPPEGEAMQEACHRVRQALLRIVRRHRNGTVAVVVPEPLASIVRCMLVQSELPNLWAVECDSGVWEAIDLATERTLETALAVSR